MKCNKLLKSRMSLIFKIGLIISEMHKSLVIMLNYNNFKIYIKVTFNLFSLILY